jgi:hypothetical protein
MDCFAEPVIGLRLARHHAILTDFAAFSATLRALLYGIINSSNSKIKPPENEKCPN